MKKYGTKDIEKRAIEIKFVNHIVDFSFKICTMVLKFNCIVQFMILFMG